MNRWEYCMLAHAIYWSVYGGDDDRKWTGLTRALNELGQEGWECCGTTKAGSIILKRPIDPQPQIVNNYNYTVQTSPINWDIPPVRCEAITRSIVHW